jgi:hypothetical protein
MTRAKTVIVEVVRVPTHPSPQWVREAWVGVTLPALPHPHPPREDAQLVDGMSPERLEVRVVDAVEALREHGRHSAAQWWSDQALLRRAGVRSLMFADHDCRMLPASAPAPAPVDPSSAHEHQQLPASVPF